MALEQSCYEIETCIEQVVEAATQVGKRQEHVLDSDRAAPDSRLALDGHWKPTGVLTTDTSMVKSRILHDSIGIAV